MTTADSASGSLPAMPQASLVGQVLDGRYKIVKMLGEGGMGQVYAAEHVHIDKRLAIKLLRPEIVSNEEAVKRFRQEARSSSEIKHPNIISIDDFGVLPPAQGGGIYMCMELLNGEALNDLITNQGLPADRMLNILIQTGHGLAAAHAKNIVHRDMKPENIFVTRGPSGEDIPKILDFGIAKVSGNDGQNHLTRTGTIFGTPFYMAPEQALGNPVDQRTDIYAMGVIAYEVFAGSLPFQGESFMGILTQHITSEPEPVAQRAAKAGRQLPNGLAEVIMRCMRKNPAERFQSMDELVSAFVAVYRGIAGAGMSTYMEAFQGQPGAHPAFTPGAMTGGVRTPTYPSGPIAMPPPGQTGAPLGQGQSQPYQVQQPGPTGSTPMYATSGTAPHQQVAKKSKLPIIIVLLVLLLGGGAVAAVLIINNSGDDTKTAKNDKPDPKDKQNPENPDKTPTNNGGGTVGSNNGGVTVNGGTGSNGSNGSNGSDVGSNAGGGLGIGSAIGSAGSLVPAPDPTIEVAISSKPPAAFELWEDGKRIIDPDNDNSDNVQMLNIVKGKPRDFVVKAKGYQDTKITVDGEKNIVHVTLVPVPGQRPPPPPPHKDPNQGNPKLPGNGSADPKNHNPLETPHPREVDCHESIKNPRNHRCVAQYCQSHEKDPICDLE
jgi:serine/threonine-protein kinase|nr:serine/threonine-protein kinase [Kofleriaceae bacterium]